jgi:two-component system, NtrC family, response regulator AtoC
VDPKPDESTKLRTARPPSLLRLVVFWDGGTSTHTLPVGAALTVGRADDCDVVIADDSVSRRHVIVRGGSPPTVEDLGSANGTLTPRVPMPLSPSVIVELGDAMLVVRGDAEEAAAPVPAASGPMDRRATIDPPMARVHELVAVVAPAKIPVIVLGETGVGKGVVAEALHRGSPHAAGPFVRVNCAAFAETLLESELFGHERGAFTGATQAKAGLIEAATGGTLLLDEVGDMPLPTQAKLLHALEHAEVLRVGSLKPRPIDVRFVAATNRDLPSYVADGRFRADLFFRLNGVTITVPPLRERPSEIPDLARGFVREACAQMGRPPVEISDAALRLLGEYAWPGNVRELRNVMVRAALFARTGRIGVEHFEIASSAEPPRGLGTGALRDEVRELEKKRVVEALAQAGDNQVAAAKALGISRGTLRSRMKDLGLLPPPKRGQP